jgi:hypothetical protein
MLTEIALTLSARETSTPGAPAGTPTATFIPPSTPSSGDQTPSTAGSGSATPTSQVCDQASFISDITVADGTVMAPGQSFTKTWRLQNVGPCTWTTGYAVVFVSGDAMSAPAVVNLSAEVPTNATLDISIDMKAPTTLGKYTGYWKLRNASGTQFGPAGMPFYVQIEVTAEAARTPSPTAGPTRTPTPTSRTPTLAATAATGAAYNFVENYCQAEWRTQSGIIACPSQEDDAKGYVLRPSSPVLEGGATETAPVLLTVPDGSASGAITGRFPAYTIRQGDRLQASAACLNSAESCSVIYQINFIAGSGSPANLGQWAHTYGRGATPIDVDLSSLAGQSIQIVLAVLNNGSSEGDQAVWINPRIVRP